MSFQDIKGSVYAFKLWMQQAQADIDAGRKQGAEVRYPAPDATVYQVSQGKVERQP